jgi:GNAT superfamily N-acetyltransferase
MRVRDYRRKDARDLVRLVRALADYESLKGPGPAEARGLAADAGRRFQVLLAEDGGRVVGYAIWFLTYSTFLARPTLWLEDLFVDPACRGTGAGTALFDACVARARKLGCGRMEWTALDWNTSAHGFYERKGAKRLKDWWIFRLTPSGRPGGRPSRRRRSPSRSRRA